MLLYLLFTDVKYLLNKTVSIKYIFSVVVPPFTEHHNDGTEFFLFVINLDPVIALSYIEAASLSASEKGKDCLN
jgi:hypothetical protein